MALKKLSITDEQAEQVKKLLAEGLSPYKISKELKITQPTLWRNMEFMGLNNKRQKEQKEEVKIFRWSDYKNKSII